MGLSRPQSERDQRFFYFMANRILRDWTASDSIETLSPQAEVFFTRLIMKADDYGSYYANPKLLNSALFPLKDYSASDINNWINECAKAGLIFCYIVDKKEYLRIENFGQRLRNMRSVFPQPVDNLRPLVSDSRQGSIIDAASSGLKRNETKRNEENTLFKNFSDDFYKNPEQAFEEIKNDEIQMEKLLLIVHRSGFRTCNNITLTLAIRSFITIEAAKPDFINRPRDEIKQHLVNWINKNAKDLQKYAT